MRASAFLGLTLAGSVLAAPGAAPPPDPGLYARQGLQVDNTFKSIEELTTFIAAAGTAAANLNQQLKKSCIDEIYASASANLTTARKVRATFPSAKDNPEYADRIVQRLARLQVYAMVFEQEARGCKDMTDASAAIREAKAMPPPVANPFTTPSAPRLERPPLASPF